MGASVRSALTVGAVRGGCQADNGRSRGCRGRGGGGCAREPRRGHLGSGRAPHPAFSATPLVALAALVAVLAGASARGDSFPVREVAPGHFVHVGRHEDMSLANRGDVANGGFVIGERGVAAIDPGGGASVGRALARALRERSALPLTHVILTHFHPDHVLGARAFVEAAGGTTDRGAGGAAGESAMEVVAHASHARAAVQRGAFYLERHAALLDGADALLVPTLEVEPGAPLAIDLGGRALEVRAYPTAHTDNDIVVFERASGTLWAGDLLVAKRTPSLAGELRGWLAVLDELAALAPRLVVFGHGEPGALEAPLEAQRTYLEALLSDVRARLAAGEGLGEALAAAEDAPKGRWALFELHHPANVTRAWTELEWE